MSRKRLVVFVSSRMEELAKERLAVKQALSELNLDAWIFENDAGARAQSVEQTFLEELEGADLYVGLFGAGYGPYTVEEYEYARSKEIDTLIYEKQLAKGRRRDAELRSFLAKLKDVETGLTVKSFKGSSDLRSSLKKDVAAWQARIVRSEKSRQELLKLGKKGGVQPDAILELPLAGGKDALVLKTVEIKKARAHARTLAEGGAAVIYKAAIDERFINAATQYKLAVQELEEIRQDVKSKFIDKDVLRYPDQDVLNEVVCTFARLNPEAWHGVLSRLGPGLGDRYLDAMEELDGAVKLYESAFSQEPSNVLGLVNYGLSLAAKLELTSARKALTKAEVVLTHRADLTKKEKAMRRRIQSYLKAVRQVERLQRDLPHKLSSQFKKMDDVQTGDAERALVKIGLLLGVMSVFDPEELEKLARLAS